MPTIHLSPATQLLSLTDVTPLAQALARKEAHRPDDVDDLVQVGLFAYHKAEMRARALHLVVEKPAAFAKCAIQRAMRGYYWQQREWQQRGETDRFLTLPVHDKQTVSALVGHDLVAFSVPAAGLDGSLRNGTQVDLLELDCYFTALERECGRMARVMVENLLMPSDECAANILDEARQKRAQQERCRRRGVQARRRQPRGVKKAIRITGPVVRKALGLSPQEWHRHMQRIKAFTRKWLSKESSGY